MTKDFVSSNKVPIGTLRRLHEIPIESHVEIFQTSSCYSEFDKVCQKQWFFRIFNLIHLRRNGLPFTHKVFHLNFQTYKKEEIGEPFIIPCLEILLIERVRKLLLIEAFSVFEIKLLPNYKLAFFLK